MNARNNKRWNPINNPKWNPINNPKNNHKHLWFKTRSILLKENPRKGQCKKCGLKIGDLYINAKGKLAILKRTHMHHIQYHDDNPMKDTIEVCNWCHSKEHRKPS